jgi:uncharacterized metal-binding protein YceD (DUF177 family)
MKVRRQFDIDIIKLSNSIHNYEFDINSSFFEQFEDSFIEKGNLKVQLTLDKSETMIQAKFQIEGMVELICDRSLEPFDFEISVNEYLVFKYGEEFSELTEEIVTIPKNLPTLNVAQYIYEFIGLAVPMKKLHPRFSEEDEEEEDEDELIEGKLIYTTLSESDEEEEKEEDPETDKIDPRWEILNNIKKNLN